MKKSIIALLMIASSLNTISGYFKIVGFTALCILLLLSFFEFVVYLVIKQTLPRMLLPILSTLATFISIYLAGLLNFKLNIQDWIAVAKLLLIIIFFLSMSLKAWSSKDIKLFAIVSALFITINTLWWIASGGSYILFQGYFDNPNTLGSYVYLLLFFPLARSLEISRFRYKILWFSIIIIGFFVLLSTNSRSSLLALIFTVLGYLLWNKITKTKWTYYLTLPVFVCFLTVALHIYLRLYNSPDSIAYNSFVYEHTGKNLFNGRTTLWLQLIDAISFKPLYGYGPATLPIDLVNIDLSAHNFYLQLLIQVGILGFLNFIIIVGMIWHILWIGRDNSIVHLAGAFLLGILVHQMFEVSLTQNNLSVGLLQWLIISIGVSRSLAIRHYSSNC
ncbi:MAG: O-antigen ligase family protein [Coleofasciculus sp. G1-WW12-02]|uniref:O-antigen ligase family protein n=1 Tax=Coleofasciculus sp. G1-WW12-02 TaxID=3068483 RepID=UPI003303664C